MTRGLSSGDHAQAASSADDHQLHSASNAESGARGRHAALGATRAASAALGAKRNYSAKLACLDLEGVLIPEVWVNLAGASASTRSSGRRATSRATS